MKKMLLFALVCMLSAPALYGAPKVSLYYLDSAGTPHVANASYPMPVSVTNSPGGAAAPASSMSTTILSVSTSVNVTNLSGRTYISIVNESGDDIYINFGGSPATSLNGHKVSAGSGIGVDCDATVTISIVSAGTSSVCIIQGGS